MFEPYNQSAVLIYQSKCATSLHGSLMSFFEIQEKPMMFSYISKNTLSIFIINPKESITSFIENIPSIISNIENPIYLFQYDKNCLLKYDNTYKTNFLSFFSNFKVQKIIDDNFTKLEDFYSYVLPECFYSFLNIDMYKRFQQTKDFYELTNFARSIMFSKLVLVIDKFSNYEIVKKSETDISITTTGNGPLTLPPETCLIDFQTEGLVDTSNILLLTIYKENKFITYFLNDSSENSQKNFRKFISRIMNSFKLVYVFNYNFSKLFFHETKNFVDIKFGKYRYWAAARKIVHLPFFHLQFDPGKGKNIPIWNKLYLLEKENLWKSLILQRTITNILTKLAILASNEVKIPFHDPIIADARRLIPSEEFLREFLKKKSLLKGKICFYPIKHFDDYYFADGKFSEMYLDNLLQKNRKEV